MFSISEDNENKGSNGEEAQPSRRRKSSKVGGLASMSIAEGEEGGEEEEEDSSSSKPEPPKEKIKRRKSSKIQTGGKEEGGSDGEAVQPVRRQRERAIALPNILENQQRSAKSLWSKGKMKLSAIRGFGGGLGGLAKKAAAGAEAGAGEANAGGGDPASAAPPPQQPPPAETASDDPSPPKMSMRKRESVVISQDGGEGLGGRRRTSLMDFANATGLGGGDGRRQSTMMAPGHLAGGQNRRMSKMGRRESSMMVRRESSMMLPNQMGGQMGGKRESIMFRRQSSMMHRQSVMAVGEIDPTSRMSKRQSSVFLQSEFEQEMRRREKEAKQHKAIKIQSEEEVKKHERAKAERLAQRDDVLTHNERVRRIIAKWKMREVQSMFLSWKRYTKKMSKAREAEKAIAPFLEVLAKESWERDEKDVDLLYSFVKKMKFFTELEENLSRDLCKMFKLEEYDEDEIVVRQGDEGDSFYIILYGSVSIWLEPKEDLESSNESEYTDQSGYSEEEEGMSERESGESSESPSSSESSSEESSSDDDGEVQVPIPAPKQEPENKEGEDDAKPEGEGGGEGDGENNEEEEDEEGGRILLCTRGPGDSFGELSLLKNQPRAATVQTDEPTFFVVIDKPDYDRTIKTRHQRKILDKVDFLCKLPIFQKCSITELAEFVCYLSEVDHPRNKIILAQGDDASNVHFVVRGTVQVIKSVPLKKKSKNSEQQFGHALLGVYDPGTYFGHNAILTKTDQPYSVVTVVETTTYVLSLHDFFLRLNSMTLQIIKESLSDNLSDEQTQTCITQHLTSSQYRKTLIESTLPPKSPKVNSHTSAFRNYDIMRKKNTELNAKFQRKIKNGKKSNEKQKKIEDLLGDDEETEKIEDMTVKYGLAAASDALKDKTHDLAKFIQARTNMNATQTKKEASKDVPSAPKKVTDLRIDELIDHNETFMDFTTDCALLVGKITAEDENALIPHELMDRVFETCNKVARDFHLVFLRWSTNSFRLISEPIHTSREKLSSKEMLIKIADSALQVNKCIEKYNDENYDEQEMLYEIAAGIAYGSAFLRKNTKTKEICDVEGQVYDISAELCAESTFLGGVRCNENIYEQLQLTHSLIISGSEFVLDGRLEVPEDQASMYTNFSAMKDAPQDKVVDVTEIYDNLSISEKAKGRKYSNVAAVNSRKYSNSVKLTTNGKSKKNSKYNLLNAAISHSYQKTKSAFNRSIEENARKSYQALPFKLPSLTVKTH
ncbi:cAMP-dependent protein kinase [Chloropicon primus]|nr:cAMP-dependent protein kinase [Chloropicon primus]